jgi:hypothetical protein
MHCPAGSIEEALKCSFCWLRTKGKVSMSVHGAFSPVVAGQAMDLIVKVSLTDSLAAGKTC